MTEDEARIWLSNKGVSRETLTRLECYVKMLLDESERQNLISDSTRDFIWTRHIVDSAQLLHLAPEHSFGGLWVDVGSGAGLPGIVIALLSQWNVILVESRRKRVEFLEAVKHKLQITNITVVGTRIETVAFPQPALVVSARAYAPLPKLLDTVHHIANRNTFWLLPKGKSWQSDVDAASCSWKGSFHVEQSVTDSESAIVIAHGVQKRSQR